jgi:hypothetical protein
VLRVLCDEAPVVASSADGWSAMVESALSGFLGRRCVGLDPASPGRFRGSDGRSVWVEPVAPSHTTEAILVEEERIVAWALDAHSDEATPSATIGVHAAAVGLDAAQADAAAAVAGDDRLVLVVGPAGTGKTTMLKAAVADLTAHGAHRVWRGAHRTGGAGAR